MDLNARLGAILDASRRACVSRSLEALDTAQGRRVSIGGSSLVNFCSNDYLGLSSHPALKHAAREAIAHFGIGSGGAALLSGRSAVHAELERRVAAFLGTESALLYSSGYLANLGLITALIHRHDVVYQDRLNHASLIDAVRLSQSRTLRYPHVDTDFLRAKLRERGTRMRWIVSDALFSMDGDIAPLAALAALAQEFDATLIADDAHGFGVLGRGRGSVHASGLSAAAVPIQVVTFGKAFGTAGAAVAGSAQLIETLVQASRTFIYDTAPPPMIAAATIAALEIIQTDRARHAKLQNNIDAFRRAAEALPLMDSTTPIQPIMIGEAAAATRIAQALRASGFYTRAIRPPTVPQGTSRIRVCLSAAHTPHDIERLAAALHEALEPHA